MNKRLQEAKDRHEKWLQDRGLTSSQIKDRKKNFKLHFIKIPNYKVENHIPLSNHIPNSAPKNTVMANRFKESDEVRKQIENKALQVAPAFNKGGYQYISPETDPTTIGRK